MKADSKNVAPFRLAAISTDSFATYKKNFIGDESGFDIGFDVDVRINAGSHIIGLLTSFVFEQKEHPVMMLTCGCHFEIAEGYWNKQVQDNQLTLPANLVTHLLVLTVGTGRGIIHAKKPHWLDQILLPTLNVSGLVKEDMVFNLDPEEEE